MVFFYLTKRGARCQRLAAASRWLVSRCCNEVYRSCWGHEPRAPAPPAPPGPRAPRPARDPAALARPRNRRGAGGVDPALTDTAEVTLRGTPGVLGAGPVRLRWVGRRLRAECSILVDPNSSVVQAHAVAVSAEHRLIHALPQLAAAVVHADPLDDADHHALLADHVALLATGDEPVIPPGPRQAKRAAGPRPAAHPSGWPTPGRPRPPRRGSGRARPGRPPGS